MLQRVNDAVCVVVGGIDAPVRACVGVWYVLYAVGHLTHTDSRTYIKYEEIWKKQKNKINYKLQVYYRYI